MWAKRERRNRREKASCSEISLKAFYPKQKREEMGLQENVSTEDTCPQVSTYQVVMVVGLRGNSHDMKSGWDVSSDGELWRSHINARWEMSQLRVGAAAHNSTSQVRPLLPSHLSSLPSNNFWTCEVSETMRHQKQPARVWGRNYICFKYFQWWYQSLKYPLKITGFLHYHTRVACSCKSMNSEETCKYLNN